MLLPALHQDVLNMRASSRLRFLVYNISIDVDRCSPFVVSPPTCPESARLLKQTLDNRGFRQVGDKHFSVELCPTEPLAAQIAGRSAEYSSTPQDIRRSLCLPSLSTHLECLSMHLFAHYHVDGWHQIYVIR